MRSYYRLLQIIAIICISICTLPYIQSYRTTLITHSLFYSNINTNIPYDDKTSYRRIQMSHFPINSIHKLSSESYLVYPLREKRKIYNKDQYRIISTSLYSVPEWLNDSPNPSPSENTEDKVTVRFINTVGGKDVVTVVPVGSNLLAVGDQAGVKLPRACRTGLCGSCTCDVQDPKAIATATNPRDGFATIRACSAKCFPPEGMNEMVVDVHRMQKRAKAIERKQAVTIGGSPVPAVIEDDYVDPMARFGENWEKEFRPQWELGNPVDGMGQVGGNSDPKSRMSVCQKCQGRSRVECYNCNGLGRTSTGQCFICVGMKTVGCGYCRGTGMRGLGKA